jgi:hypothetical protein
MADDWMGEDYDFNREEWYMKRSQNLIIMNLNI